MAPDTSIEKNEMFDMAFRFVTETNENVFLTGKAGTGKTTFLKYLREHAAKNIIVAAPTGVAAINAGGVTLHSLFQLPFHPFLPTRNNKDQLLGTIRYTKQRIQLLRKMELLVIDEISMVRCDTMDAIDTLLRSVRREHSIPFGGVQLLCIGDLFQLPPVAQNQEWNILKEFYASPFFFDSLVIKEQIPLLIELNKVYRQKEDYFVSLLNKVRNNQMSPEDFENLHLRYDPSFKPAEADKYITLTSHNHQADTINRQRLQQNLSPEYIYEAVIEDDFPEKIYPAEAKLVLKKGAQVMFLKNDAVMKRYFNGKIGIIKSLDKDSIIVTDEAGDIELRPETWENTRYELNRNDGKLEQQTLGTFTQFPLRLAWAITIHKSQGLTFDKVMIDAGAAFSSGQVYVALSRCTGLEGIVLLSKIPASSIYSNESVLNGQRTLTPRGSLQERFAGARQVFTQQLLEQLFSFEVLSAAADALLIQVTQQEQKLNAGAVDWTREIKKRISAEKETGARFMIQVDELLRPEGIIENNEPLRKRVGDAANHFLPKLEVLLHDIQQHPLVTEHKEAADNVNEYLQSMFLVSHAAAYGLAFCKQPFSVTGFLKHKLDYALPRITISCYARGKKQQATDIPHPELFETLRKWRDTICEATSTPIYMVANQASLKEIATFLPKNKKDLQLLSGFGRARAEKYGDDIIDAVTDYCSRYDLETNMHAKDPAPKKEKKTANASGKAEPKPDTKMLSFELFKAGKTIEEIARERNFTPGTILGHLTHFVGTGEIPADHLVSPDKQQLIKEGVDRLGTQSLKTLLENMPEGITYHDIKIVLASPELAGN